MHWQTFQVDRALPRLEELESLFTEIGNKARLSGNGRHVLILDRVPGLVIGRENSKDNDVLENSMAESLEKLQEINRAINADTHRG